jgi:hypothetical protein
MNIDENKMVEKLNKLLEIDRDAITNLFNKKVLCNDDLADTDNIQVACYGKRFEETGKCSLSILGILNYLVDDTNKGKIFKHMDNKGSIIEFVTLSEKEHICESCGKHKYQK